MRRGNGDWLRVFEVAVPFPVAPGFDVRSAENGDRHLEDSEPVPVLGRAPSHRRRGLASVVILIGLIIVGLVCAGLLRVALARRAEVGMEERRLQANWLAESALGRASARLAESEAYAGETWEVGPEELGGRGPGSVLIRVESIPEHPNRRRVTVRADYPSHSDRRARRSLEAVLPLTPRARSPRP